MNKNIFKQNIKLENNRVQLIPFESLRNGELKNIVFEDSIWQYMGMFIRSENDLKNYIENTIEDKKNEVSYPFLIIDKRNGCVAGSTRYGYVNIASQKCEIGWTWYGKQFQGTGLNKACKYVLLNFGFEHIGFRCIQFSADFENIRSQNNSKCSREFRYNFYEN